MKRGRDDLALTVSEENTKRSRDDNSKALIAVGKGGVLRLEGHSGGVSGLSFDVSGRLLASCSADQSILLWDVDGVEDKIVSGGVENIGALKGHSKAVQQVQWIGSERVVSCSADKTLGVWDSETGERVRELRGHSDVVNCCCAFDALVASGGDDRVVRLWDERATRCIKTLIHPFQVTAGCFLDDRLLYSGSVDGCIRAWDVRKTGKALFEMPGENILTGLAGGGATLVSNAVDGSVCQWDGRPFALKEDRLVRTLGDKDGNKPAANKDWLLLRVAYSETANRICAGMWDKTVAVWNATSGKLEQCLGGHAGPVLAVDVHPTGSVVASGSLDKTILLGNLP